MKSSEGQRHTPESNQEAFEFWKHLKEPPEGAKVHLLNLKPIMITARRAGVSTEERLPLGLTGFVVPRSEWADFHYEEWDRSENRKCPVYLGREGRFSIPIEYLSKPIAEPKKRNVEAVVALLRKKRLSSRKQRQGE